MDSAIQYKQDQGGNAVWHYAAWGVIAAVVAIIVSLSFKLPMVYVAPVASGIAGWLAGATKKRHPGQPLTTA